MGRFKIQETQSIISPITFRAVRRFSVELDADVFEATHVSLESLGLSEEEVLLVHLLRNLSGTNKDV